MKSIVLPFLALLACSSFAAAQTSPQAWAAAQPKTTLSVVEAPEKGMFQLDATVIDTLSNQVLARPMLLIRSGVPATVEVGVQDGRRVRLVVSVAENGKEASYQSEFLDADRVLQSESGAVKVGRSG